jgi:hypothetical protein
MKFIITNKYLVLILLMLVSFVFWFFVFTSVQETKPSGTQTDRLSGEKINLDSVNSAETPNPYVPYFVGFNTLSDSGVSSDDMRYIQDVIINYTLYKKQIRSAKVSYVKDSFKNILSEDLDSTYSFRFGINDTDIHTIKVTSNMITSKITIVITDSSNKKVFERTFDIYSV